jgi:hypothetical protein
MTLRVVLPAEATGVEMSMDDAGMEAMQRVLAQKPVMLTILYELADGTVNAASLPNSAHVERAIVATRHAYHSPATAEEA